MVPVVALYSTFLQRAYDQVMQDIGLLKLHVVLAIDRAGLVGEDGETHHGAFDVGFLSQVPGMTILCPVSLSEQRHMLRWAVKEFDGPVTVRYPRGGNGAYTASDWGSGTVATHRKGDDVTIISYGVVANHAIEAARMLAERGVEATVLRLMQVAPLNMEQIREKLAPGRRVIVVEETCTGSGVGDALARNLPDREISVIDLGGKFATHGNMNTLYKHYGLDAQSIADYTWEAIRG